MSDKRLIDANAITDDVICHYLGRDYCSCAPDIRDMLNDAPTVPAVVLPCDVDFRVWCEGNNCYILYGGNVEHCLILSASFNYKGEIYLDLYDEKERRHTKDLSEIGKTVFLTREEAEAALKEKRE